MTGEEPKRYEYHPPGEEPQPEEQPSPPSPPEQPKPEKGRGKTWVFGVVILVAFVAGFLLINGEQLTGFVIAEPAAAGDRVAVLYTGTLDDGTVFDTNVEDVANAAGIDKPAFPLFEFTLGTGQVIPGFDAGITGMRTGETKTIVIPPEEAYGLVDPALVQVVPRTSELDREQELTIEDSIPEADFIELFAVQEVGDIFTPPGGDFDYEIIANEDGLVTYRALVEEGESYTFPGVDWPAEVLSIEGTTAMIRHDPEPGERESQLGTEVIEVTEDQVIITVNPELGQEIFTLLGVGRVVGVSEEEVTIDFNNELAGEQLTFEVTLVEIY